MMPKRNQIVNQAVEGQVVSTTWRPPRLATVRDCRREMARVYADARSARIDPSDATRLAYILKELITAISNFELEQRINELERRLSNEKIERARDSVRASTD